METHAHELEFEQQQAAFWYEQLQLAWRNFLIARNHEDLEGVVAAGRQHELAGRRWSQAIETIRKIRTEEQRRADLKEPVALAPFAPLREHKTKPTP